MVPNYGSWSNVVLFIPRNMIWNRPIQFGNNKKEKREDRMEEWDGKKKGKNK